MTQLFFETLDKKNYISFINPEKFSISDITAHVDENGLYHTFQKMYLELFDPSGFVLSGKPDEPPIQWTKFLSDHLCKKTVTLTVIIPGDSRIPNQSPTVYKFKNFFVGSISTTPDYLKVSSEML